jgi:hypothetical protein
MALFAKFYSGGIQIQRRVIFWPKRSRKIRSAAAVAAAHFQNIFPAQINLRCDMMIQLDARAVRLVVRRERNVHRRIFLVSIVEK